MQIISSFANGFGFIVAHRTNHDLKWSHRNWPNNPSLVVTLLNFAIPTYDAAAPLLDWGFKNADKVTPVGYLVEPVAPAFDEPPAPAPADNPGAPEGQTTTDTGAQGSDAAEPGSTPVASGSTAASTASWTSGWVWGLIAAMAVGLLLIGVQHAGFGLVGQQEFIDFMIGQRFGDEVVQSGEFLRQFLAGRWRALTGVRRAHAASGVFGVIGFMVRRP